MTPAMTHTQDKYNTKIKSVLWPLEDVKHFSFKIKPISPGQFKRSLVVVF